MLSLAKLYEELTTARRPETAVCGRLPHQGRREGNRRRGPSQAGSRHCALFACSPGERSFENDRWKQRFFFTLLEGCDRWPRAVCLPMPTTMASWTSMSCSPRSQDGAEACRRGGAGRGRPYVVST
jgi:hypothetical protein